MTLLRDAGHDPRVMQVISYSESDAELWDEFVARAPMATFLHTRRFLSYHGARFTDCSLLLKEEHRLLGLFPAALAPEDDRQVLSHPGITYGGVLHTGALRGARMFNALAAIAAHYTARGYETLRYKAVPYIYQQMPAADDLYALAHAGAVRYRCDLSCAIDLAQRLVPSTRRQRGQKKARAAGIEVADGAQHAAPLWRVLADNLNRKYGARPVHTLAEIEHLHTLFPANISFVVALHAGEVVAGVVLFTTPRVMHTQYIAASMLGYETCALDAVLAYCIAQATERQARYFDFGTSNGSDGESLNAGLYQFKSEFGGGGVLHEFYQLGLRQWQE